MKVKDMKLEAQSLFLGVCVHNYAPSRVEGLHRRFPLAWINRKNYKYYSHPILKSMSLTYEYGNNLAYCLFEHAKENEELRLELKSILMERLLERIDEITEPGADLSVLRADGDSYLDFCDLASFIMDQNAVIIQHTDEYTTKDLKRMQKLVIDYVKKNKGMCFVDWPLGG